MCPSEDRADPSAATTRHCEDCDDETRHRQAGDDSFECLPCHERIEIEAALGINGSGRGE